MAVPADVENLLAEIVARWSTEIKIENISALTPDASLRRYYRINLRGAAHPTAVAMVFDSVASPEHDGGCSVTADVASVELGRFFGSHGVSVPELYCDARDPAVLLIEDLGDRPLIGALSPAYGVEGTHIRKKPDALYTDALEQIRTIQAIPHVAGFFPFERKFGASLYFKEMLEFRDFVLMPRRATASLIKIAERTCTQLAEDLDKLPKALVHRDFHSWNLLIDAKECLRVIDYQDALLATRCYDIVALLNDRDTDAALGAPLYAEMLDNFAADFRSRGEFELEYYPVLLQRDLKVAGRFAKLASQRGLIHYEKWIPGTLRRIGRTLRRLSENSPAYREFSKAVGTIVAEVSGA